MLNLLSNDQSSYASQYWLCSSPKIIVRKIKYQHSFNISPTHLSDALFAMICWWVSWGDFMDFVSLRSEQIGKQMSDFRALGHSFSQTNQHIQLVFMAVGFVLLVLRCISQLSCSTTSSTLPIWVEEEELIKLQNETIGNYSWLRQHSQVQRLWSQVPQSSNIGVIKFASGLSSVLYLINRIKTPSNAQISTTTSFQCRV
jgi:hypothetical protein